MKKISFNRESGGKTVGTIGMWGLHLVAILFMIYSAYHGIHATTNYRAASGLGNIAGILGIISIEITLASLYLAAVHHKILGSNMQFAAGITAAIGFTIAALSIVGDSQMQAGMTPPPWLNTYLTVVLPAAPVLMALGTAITLLVSPLAARMRTEAEDLNVVAEQEHDMTMQTRLVEAQAEMTARQIELDTKLALLAHLEEYAKGPDARRMIAATAEREGPNVLRAAGVYISDGDAAPRVGSPGHMSKSTHDAPRQDVPQVIPLATPEPGQGGNGPSGRKLGGADGDPSGRNFH